MSFRPISTDISMRRTQSASRMTRSVARGRLVSIWRYFPLNVFHIAQRLYVQVLCADESGLRHLFSPSYTPHDFFDFLIFFERSDARTPISETAVPVSSVQNLAAWCPCHASVECLMNFCIFRFFSRSEARGHQFRKRLYLYKRLSKCTRPPPCHVPSPIPRSFHFR